MGLAASSVSHCQRHKIDLLCDDIDEAAGLEARVAEVASALVFSPKKKPRPSTRLAVVRHGERLDDANAAAWLRSQGGRDFPFDCSITAQGRRQAASVGRELASFGFQLVITSPFARCVQTASVICKEMGLPLCLDYELGEVFAPDYFGKRWATSGPVLRSAEEIIALVPPGIQLICRSSDGDSDEGALGTELQTEFVTHPAILGTPPVWPEAVHDARLRFGNRVEYYASLGQRTRANVVLVTHGHCIQASATLALAAERGLDCKTVVQRVRYCSYVLLDRDLDECNPQEDACVIPLEDRGWRMYSRGVDFGVDFDDDGSRSRDHVSPKSMVVAMQRSRAERRRQSACEESLRSSMKPLQAPVSRQCCASERAAHVQPLGTRDLNARPLEFSF
eukprot:TRINITY_DN8207_c0_g1_i1.p1 TRINITY_DN8207_c0_g1~~TRINITY_DN8207_c0_g1_i1.p1  ORF type:complete len:421 (-),score=66.97 TRINITY_DN8207_c0_g1_i1:255-1433(-)